MRCKSDDSFYTLQVCYHPTTVLSVDDDDTFLKNLDIEISDEQALLYFSNPEKARDYIRNDHLFSPFISRCLINEKDNLKFNLKAIREEVYNPDRFNEICVYVTDYDMPHTDGLELIRTLEFPPDISQFSQIILTGKISDKFKEKLKNLSANLQCIGKDDPQYVRKLLNAIEERVAKIFQRYSYIPARMISNDTQDGSSFLFDGNFADLFYSYLEKNNICEFYLFDKQGSYLMLDKFGKLSWLFVRNDRGIENTIKLAQEYGAPKTVVDALSKKELILSLYNHDDFKQLKNINWDDYLFTPTIFESNAKYLNFFSNLMPKDDEGNDINPKYYYTFSNEAPLHGVDKSRILSYHDFLQQR